MTPEEFQRIKEAEKEHLRKIRALKKAARGFERTKKVHQALENMAHSTDEVMDTHAEMLGKLDLDAAQKEAMLEIALSSAEEKETKQAAETFEKDLQKERAADLVRRMKAQLAASSLIANTPSQQQKEIPGKSGQLSPGKTRKEEEEAHPDSTVNPIQNPDDLPEKTIGRM